MNENLFLFVEIAVLSILFIAAVIGNGQATFVGNVKDGRRFQVRGLVLATVMFVTACCINY